MVFENLKKKKKVFCLIILIYSILYIPSVSAYWGWGECQEGHSIKYINVPYDPNAYINLDGVPNEPHWTDPSNNKGYVNISLASNFGSANFFIVYLDLMFVMNDNYLFILAQWKDTSTRPSDGSKDGLYFCWNVNVPNFSAAFFGGMRTDIMGNGTIDLWAWDCKSDTHGPSTSYLCKDTYYDDDGIVEEALDVDDVSVAYTYVADKSYTLEMRRNLNTNPLYDVQFAAGKIYKFNMAILNDGSHEDHAVSWTYALDLRSDSDNGDDDDDDSKQPQLNINLIIIISTAIAIAGIITVLYFINKKSKRNIQ